MSETTPDPRELADPTDPGGLIDGGATEMPGVHDRGYSEEEADVADVADVPDQGQDSSFNQPA